jgi:hypothetical protein
MDKHPQSFLDGDKTLSAYFSKPTSRPIRVQLIDGSLSEVLIKEVERYFEVTR